MAETKRSNVVTVRIMTDSNLLIPVTCHQKPIVSAEHLTKQMKQIFNSNAFINLKALNFNLE